MAADVSPCPRIATRRVPAEKTLAIIIRLADFSESSRVVTMFTRDFGKVAAIAKGAKRLRSPFEAALDLLGVCEVVILRKSSGGLDIVTEAKLRQRFTPIRRQLGHLYAGYYLAELVDATCEPYDAHPLLYDEANTCLERLATPADLAGIISRFELTLLREIGQLPIFDACASCASVLGTSTHYCFRVASGGLICRHCGGEEAQGIWIGVETARFIQQLFNGPIPNAQEQTLPPRARSELRSVINSTIAHVLGRRPKTLRYLPL